MGAVLQNTRCAVGTIQRQLPSAFEVHVPWVSVRSPLKDSLALQGVLEESTMTDVAAHAPHFNRYPAIVDYLCVFLKTKLRPGQAAALVPAGVPRPCSTTDYTAWFLLAGPLRNTLVVTTPGIHPHVRFDVASLRMSFQTA